MLPPYAKPHLSFADQVRLLQQRGLGITDAWQAERHLARVGYYRLKDYLEPLRQSRQAVDADGTRYTEILEDFPYLEREDIAAALEFAALQSDNPIIKTS